MKPYNLYNQKGSALVVVLSATALIVALLIEFVYAVYISSASFDYWKKAQSLSLAARSGIVLSSRVMTETKDIYYLSPSGFIVMPVEKVTASFKGALVIRAYDENSRFNVNSLVYQNGQINPETYGVFKRLLKQLNINEDVADFIADWIDRDSEERINGSEQGAKNLYLDALDELYQIKGINPEDIGRLWDYVTVYGYDRTDSSVVNINSAPLIVIMALDERITKGLAERIVQYRTLQPFKSTAEITKVSGFEGALGQSLIGRIAVTARNLRIFSEAEDGRTKRVIECVVELQGRNQTVRYWSER